MKTVLLVRHSEATDHDPVMGDSGRSLTPAGKETACRMAGKLAEKEKGRMVIISSPAFRAVETALIFAPRLNTSCEDILIRDSVYGFFDKENFFRLLSELDDKEEKVILFGHNPSLTTLINSLSGSNDKFLQKSGIACLHFDTDKWGDLSAGKASLSYLLNA